MNDIYSEPLFRPPSEGNSIIVQATEGCSYNKCLFCAMYKMKKYREKNIEELSCHLDNLSEYVYPDTNIKRAFIADGDALTVESSRLLEYMFTIKKKFPQVNRFGIYGSVYSLQHKNVKELKELRNAGLRFIYLGIESGDPKVLKKINKYTPESDIIENCQKVKEADINLSIMIILGLGGTDLSSSHITKSAEITNRICPDYTSLLNIMLEHTALLKKKEYQDFNMINYLQELELFITGLDCKTIFRSNHASNYLPLAGNFPRQKEMLLSTVREYSVKYSS